MKNYPWKSSAFCVFVPHHDEVAEFCEMIENTLAKDGIDTLFLIVRYDFEFQSHPECRGDFPITLEDAKQILAACRKNNIRLVPKMNLLGMGRTIAVVNQKGGVGKTTTAVNLTAALTELGLKVLLCDFDPQANATSGLGVDKRKVKHSVYDVVIDKVAADQAIVHTKFGDVLPSSADLAGAAVELIVSEHREHQLKKALESVKENYDAILIDCPPSLEMLTLNGLAAADSILIPVQCEYYALEGLSDLMTTLRIVKKRVNPTLDIFAVLLTMFDGRTNFSTQVAQEVRRHFPGKVLSTVVPRNVRLSEAPSHGLPVTAYDRASKGAVAYRNIAQEIKGKL